MGDMSVLRSRFKTPRSFRILRELCVRAISRPSAGGLARVARDSFSSTQTFIPSLAKDVAKASPVGPPPITITSQFLFVFFMLHYWHKEVFSESQTCW